jgi:DNA-binding XRE family transcriptional regulator
MYRIINPGEITFKYGTYQEKADIIGIRLESLSRILKGKQNTQYTTAYCIVKLFNPEKEVLDYFQKID